jgi:hypothetical protein
MNRYLLHVKVGDDWACIAHIEAPNHAAAFREAMIRLNPDHHDKQIRLEQQSGPSAQKK